jgi:RNA polymerase sigma-B factor
VRRFLPLARKLARRYYSGGEPLDDLVQVASLGLVKAIERFDETRGVSFSSYAVPTITGELRRYFRDSVWPVHVPRGMQERALAVNGASRELADDTGRNPTVSMLADRLELDEQGVLDGLKAYEAFDTLSLDAPASADGEAEPRARIETIGATDPGFELTEERLTVGAVVQRLPFKERRVLHMRYVEDCTQSDIAARIGVSQMQVSRILNRTIDRLQRTVELSTTRAVGQPQLRPHTGGDPVHRTGGDLRLEDRRRNRAA